MYSYYCTTELYWYSEPVWILEKCIWFVFRTKHLNYVPELIRWVGLEVCFRAEKAFIYIYTVLAVREKENVYFRRKRMMPILLPNLCYIVLQNKPAPIRSEKKHNIIPTYYVIKKYNKPPPTRTQRVCHKEYQVFR